MKQRRTRRGRVLRFDSCLVWSIFTLWLSPGNCSDRRLIERHRYLDYTFLGFDHHLKHLGTQLSKTYNRGLLVFFCFFWQKCYISCVSINKWRGKCCFHFWAMLEADLMSEVIHLFIFFFPAPKCNQLTCLRKRLKTVFYSVNVEEAQSLLWVVWFRIKLKSLFLKHSCADITLICARRQLVYFSSVCQTSF